MKSQRRHDLKENALAHELGQLRTFLSKYGNWMAAALAGILLVVLVIMYFQKRSERELMDQQQQLEQLMTFDEKTDEKGRLAKIREFAETAKDPVLASQAALFLGDLYLQRELNVTDHSSAEARELRDQARKNYELVLQRFPNMKLLTAKAHFGLGMVAVNARDRAAAEQHFQAALERVGKSEELHRMAQRELANLDRNLQAVMFVATTRAATTATGTAPAAAPLLPPITPSPATAKAAPAKATATAKAPAATGAATRPATAAATTR